MKRANKTVGRPRVDAVGIMVKMPPDELADLDRWIAGQSPKPSRPGALRRLAQLSYDLAEENRPPVKRPAR